MPRKDDALIIESAETVWSNEEGATVVPLAGGWIVITVAQEHAVDSYNDSFTNSITMSREQVIELRDWLNEHLEEATK